jgi:hypothetical protein
MPGFCEKCGSPVGDGKFCPKCGAAVSTAPPVAGVSTPASSTPAGSTIPPAATTPQGGGGIAKVLIIVVAVIGIFVVLSMGSCFYMAYRIKKKATEFTQAQGSTRRYSGKRDACSLIKASDVSDAIGQSADVDEGSSTSSNCSFTYGSGGANRVNVEFTWQGGALAMNLAHGAMKQIGGMETFTPVEDLGDEAYLAPMGSMLMMRKGDVLVQIDLRTAGLNADAGKKIAAKIASRL